MRSFGRMGGALVLLALGASQMGGCDFTAEGTNPARLGLTAGPFVAATVPAAGSSGAPTNTKIAISFSEAMDPATLVPANLLLEVASTAAPVPRGLAIAPGSGAVTISPSASLAVSTTYRVVVAASVRDAGGVSMGADHAFTFTTAAAADLAAPSFAGATSASALSSTSIRVSWNAATDNVDAAASIVYALYSSTSSGGQSYATPTALSAPGATSFDLGGLSVATRYWVVVRARDGSGNQDSNTVQLDAVTDSALALPSWSLAVAPMLKTYCGVSGCHVPAQERPDMSASASTVYTTLVNRASGRYAAWYVRPGDVANSAIHKCIQGGQMPPSGRPKPTAVQLSDLGAWISGGAPNN